MDGWKARAVWTILTEEDFIDEDYHTVAKRLFDQYRDSGTVNPAAIVNLFEDI